VAQKLANMDRGNPTFKTANLRDSEPSLPLPVQATAQPRPQVSQSDAARLLNVSERSVATARKVQEQAPPEVARAVEAGPNLLGVQSSERSAARR
jgi:hypothetical protein